MTERPPAASAVRIDPATVRRTLREAGLRARHSMSQNFLADPAVLEAILAEAAPAPRSRVLEIGPVVRKDELNTRELRVPFEKLTPSAYVSRIRSPLKSRPSPGFQ